MKKRPKLKLIDGKKIAEEIQQELAAELKQIQGKRPPCLAVILVGDQMASRLYVNRKTKACGSVGIKSIKKEFPHSISEAELLHQIDLLNRDPTVDGILVQLPLPHQISPGKIMYAIDPAKDVDGFHPLNVGKLLIGDPEGFQPCTPLGIKVLLEKSHVETAGKNVVVLGRSNIVGKPMAAMLMQSPWGNATVTLLHSQSKNIAFHCQHADILIAAIGKPRFITAEMVKEGAVVIDVGMNRSGDVTLSDGKQLVGDVDFDAVKDKCALITPVPGGVGPMTIAMLLYNTIKSYKRRVL
jgi:methylenetetrahydrofolate dehydrogenase (NADP+) / methenyltetrahydrofolate cyclohydrolase